MAKSVPGDLSFDKIINVAAHVNTRATTCLKKGAADINTRAATYRIHVVFY